MVKFKTLTHLTPQTMLHYHIAKKIPYSQLFSFMERLKENYHDMMEDYSVTETTLEEVFLSFAEVEH